MLPSDQCLEAQHLAAAGVDDRLVVQRQLVVAERGAQLALHVESVVDLAAHRLVEQGDPSPAGLLGGVHRQVGALHDLVGRIGSDAERDADAHRHDVLATVEADRCLHGRQQAVGDGGDLEIGADVAAHDQELVAAEASDDVAAAGRGLQPVGDDLQQPVADGVTEAVVDDLEVVEVAEHHGHAFAIADRVGQQVEELLPVRQAGQRVVAGVVGQPRLEPLAIGQVAVGHGEPLDRALLVTDADGNARHRVALAVLIDHLDLAAPRATVADRLADLGEHRLAVFLGDELQGVVAVQRVGAEESLAGRVEVVGAVTERGDGHEVGRGVGHRSEPFHLASPSDLVVHVADDHDGAGVVAVVVDGRRGHDLHVAGPEVRAVARRQL